MVLPRIPYTSPLPPPQFLTSKSLHPSIAALTAFLTTHNRPLLLTGAGISVQSGLSDYRGPAGTYRLNTSYRPIFFSEFISRHESRQRYWARSYLGWPLMAAASPNAAHYAVGALWRLGVSNGGLITQNVDSLHHRASPDVPCVELHGTLRTLTCLTCEQTTPREQFQLALARLNPRWADFLLDHGGVKEVKTNPDGDVDLPGAPYTTFRYPACAHCLSERPGEAKVDGDGAYAAGAGILKPSVTFFGESVGQKARETAERWLRDADAVLVVGSSLATYSAWRLVRDADAGGKGIAVMNLGGVRGDEVFFGSGRDGRRVRLEFPASEVLVGVVRELGGSVEGEEARPRAAGENVGVGG